MKIAELAEQAGIAPSAVRFYEEAGILPPARRTANGYRDFGPEDLARLRLVVALRRLGLGPLDAGRLARLCLEHGSVDADLGPMLAGQRAAIARQRDELDRLEVELADLEDTIAAAGRGRRDDTMSEAPIRVLLVCTGNSARSQMAEALLKRYGGADFEVFSAGTEPKGVNPRTVRVLAEAGIDWSAARSKSIQEFVGQPFDYVITVCDRAKAACPRWPGQDQTLHWGLEDPAEVEGTEEEKLAAFRRTGQEISARLRPFVELARRARRTLAVAG